MVAARCCWMKWNINRGDIVKIIVELDDLCHIAARIEMYADLLDGLDEADDIDYVPGYTEEIKRAAQDLREVVDDAEEVKGE